MHWAAEMGSNSALKHKHFWTQKTRNGWKWSWPRNWRCKWHHTISGNILLFLIHQILKKVVQKLQSTNFVTTPSVAAVLWGQPTLWGVLYSAKQKLEYRHVSPSTKKMMRGEQFRKMHSEHLAKSCEDRKMLLLVKKRKQAVMHKLLTPCGKTSAESSSQKPGSKELDGTIASYFCENDIMIWVHWETCCSDSFGSNEIWSNYSMPTSSKCLLVIMKMCAA